MFAVILSGGAGSRLWPLSREAQPKPFMKLADGLSLLQKTYLRALALPLVDNVVTVTHRDFLFQTKDHYQHVLPHCHANVTHHYLLEPIAKNTAAAIAAAAMHVSVQQGDDQLMLVMPADHVIRDQEALCQAVLAAMELAKQRKLVVFGITPTEPSTGYGYIQARGHEVVAFVEKPISALAEQYFTAGDYFWNSGMLLGEANVILQEMVRHCPDIIDGVVASYHNAETIMNNSVIQVSLSADDYATLRSESFDYAVLEHAASIATVTCAVGWSDVGSYQSMSELTMPDAEQNRVIGEAILEECSDCYIHSENRLVAGLGLHDTIIIDTKDALLVADKSRAEEVKKIYQRLKDAGNECYKLHKTVTRPWGTYTELEQGPNFKIKRIEVSPGASLSLQMHYHRSEHWVVVSGTAKVVNGDHEMLIHNNESTYIKSGVKHRLTNPGLLPLILIEVQCGDYLGEDDIVRFEDIYGRERQDAVAT